jgi:UDP-N-acetylglucosamine acyltransferase
VIMGETTLGAGNEVFPGAVLGAPPQDRKYHGEAAQLLIGDNNIIREHVTMHLASVGGDGITRVGSGGMYMAGSHVAHDCSVGDNVTMINHAVLGGHVQVADNVMIGGNSAVHQFVRIGTGAMIGGMTGVEGDVIPYGLVMGDRAWLHGLNWVGLKRRGLTKAQVAELNNFYQAVFVGAGTFADRLAAAQTRYADNALVKPILDFIAEPSRRALCLPE